MLPDDPETRLAHQAMWLQMEGVRGIFCAAEKEGSSQEGQHQKQYQHPFTNEAGHMRKDEVVFADHIVHVTGQMIAMVVADTEVQVSPAAFAVD